jgi:hypothetical protein
MLIIYNKNCRVYVKIMRRIIIKHLETNMYRFSATGNRHSYR